MFANLQAILQTWFAFTKLLSCLRIVNYTKKHENCSDVQCLILLFKHLLAPSQLSCLASTEHSINSEPGTN